LELRYKDPQAFLYFMRMPPAMFDEVEQKMTCRLTKRKTPITWNLVSNWQSSYGNLPLVKPTEKCNTHGGSQQHY
jgi:hypothetical protein